MVRGAAVVVDFERRHAEALREATSKGEGVGGRPGNGRADALKAHTRVGNALKRMESECVNAGVRQRGQRRRAARMSHQGRGGRHRLCGCGDFPIGDAEQDGVAARGTLAASERPLDLDSGVAKRPRERGADPPGADEAHPKWAVEAGL